MAVVVNHGTIYAYMHHRCRCDPCKRVVRSYRQEHDHRRSGLSDKGELVVECWCHAKLVEVPATDVRDGQTMSCGAADCRDTGN